MKNRRFNFLKMSAVILTSLVMVYHAAAEEKIIQQEKISFEKCLKVIITSENKLSLAPEIITVSDQKRVAIFTLADGTLKITCDGDLGSVVVSTNTN